MSDLTIKSTNLEKRKSKLEQELLAINSQLTEKENQNLNYQEEITGTRIIRLFRGCYPCRLSYYSRFCDYVMPLLA